MRRIALVSALLLGLSGCSLLIDPDKVPEPKPNACVPVCSGVACGAGNGCGAACAPGSGCTVGHLLRGRLTPGAGNASATAAHSVARGTLATAEAAPATPGSHSISQGTLSP